VSKAKPTAADGLLTLIAVAIIVLVAAGGGFLILLNLPPSLTSAPFTVVVLLVAGFVAVTLLLYLGTIILRTAGLGSRREALGMPEGSIRALIAMSLILIFAIIGVTVLYSGLGGETIQSKGITAAEIDRLENVQIVAISEVTPGASPGAERFDVTAKAELSQAGHDFGLQLLSTVSTLVVAVAGFYFGSRSVAQATKATAEAQSAAAQAASTAIAAAAAATAARPTVPPPAGAPPGATDVPLNDDEIIGAVEDLDDVDDVTDEPGTPAPADAPATAATPDGTVDATTEAADAAADAEAEAAAAADAEAGEDGDDASGGTPGTRP
jgi:hypothetical protein